MQEETLHDAEELASSALEAHQAAVEAASWVRTASTAAGSHLLALRQSMDARSWREWQARTPIPKVAMRAYMAQARRGGDSVVTQ